MWSGQGRRGSRSDRRGVGDGGSLGGGGGRHAEWISERLRSARPRSDDASSSAADYTLPALDGISWFILGIVLPRDSVARLSARRYFSVTDVLGCAETILTLTRMHYLYYYYFFF